MADLGPEGNGSAYINQSLCYGHCCGHGGKSYTTQEEFPAGICLVIQSKKQYMNMAIPFLSYTYR